MTTTNNTKMTRGERALRLSIAREMAKRGAYELARVLFAQCGIDYVPAHLIPIGGAL